MNCFFTNFETSLGVVVASSDEACATGQLESTGDASVNARRHASGITNPSVSISRNMSSVESGAYTSFIKNRQ